MTGCSNRLSSKAAGTENSESYVVWYVEEDEGPRTTLGACFNILNLAGPGDPAAPRTFCLPLLPSGPGGVHRVLLHRARPLGTLKVFIRRPQSTKVRRRGRRHEQARFGGEGGIRTHGPVAETHAFQACRFVHSRTSPRRFSKGGS
jgi:hypothetical protein